MYPDYRSVVVSWNRPSQATQPPSATSSSHRLRLKAKAIETKTKANQARAMAATPSKTAQSEFKDNEKRPDEPHLPCSDDSDKDVGIEEKRQLRQRTFTQQASFFRCTVSSLIIIL